MANVKQVAALAGVSSATVSRALSAPEQLRPETLERVKDAISQLNYVPVESARSLRMGRTNTVGIIAPTLMNELYAKAVDTLERQLDAQGLTVLLTCHRDNKETELECARTLLGRGVEALAMIGSQHHPELFPMIRRHKIPYVLMWATDSSGTHPTVGYDNRVAMRRLTEYLIGLGHREIAVLPGPLSLHEISAQRLDGVKDALVDAGVPLHHDRILPTSYDVGAIRAAARELLLRQDRPTALICNNDVIAAAAIAECHALGIAVPADISVTGFGDWQMAELISPTLTTVHSNPMLIGELTASMLVAKLKDPDGSQSPQSLFEAQMVIRNSTAIPLGHTRR
jgi:LacI family transcriptional regulator